MGRVFGTCKLFVDFFCGGVFFCGVDLFRGVRKMVVGVGDIYNVEGFGNFVY